MKLLGGLDLLLAFLLACSSHALDCSNCGMANHPQAATSRIFEGESAEPNEFPWQAYITYLGFIRCGGTLINENYVLSAAQCRNSWDDPADFNVTLGEHDVSCDDDGTELILGVEDIYDLGSYDLTIRNKDIALYKLKTTVQFNDFIRPICIKDANFEGEDAVISGWGAIDQHVLPETLQFFTATVKTTSSCNSLLQSADFKDYHVCLFSNSSSTCSGDHGGPAVVDDGNGVYYLAGISSFTYKGCNVHFPMGFPSVKYFLDKIKEKVGDELCYSQA